MPRWSELPDKLKADLRAKAARRSAIHRVPYGIFVRSTYRDAGVRFEVVKPEHAPDTWKLLVLVGPKAASAPDHPGSSRRDIMAVFQDDARKRPAPWEGRGRQE